MFHKWKPFFNFFFQMIKFAQQAACQLTLEMTDLNYYDGVKSLALSRPSHKSGSQKKKKRIKRGSWQGLTKIIM